MLRCGDTFAKVSQATYNPIYNCIQMLMIGPERVVLGKSNLERLDDDLHSSMDQEASKKARLEGYFTVVTKDPTAPHG